MRQKGLKIRPMAAPDVEKLKRYQKQLEEAGERLKCYNKELKKFEKGAYTPKELLEELAGINEFFKKYSRLHKKIQNYLSECLERI